MLPTHRPEGAFELAGVAHAQRLQLDPERCGHDLEFWQGRSSNRVVRVRQHRHPRDRWHRLFQQLQPLATQLSRVRGQPRDVPTWPRDVGNQPRPHRIPTGEDDRNARCCLTGGSGGRHIPRDVTAQAHQEVKHSLVQSR
jgi:hypothetical protein